MLVVCDTTAINYLLQIGEIDLIHRLFGSACIPPSVHRELLHPRAPDIVRSWTADLPPWITVRDPGLIVDPRLIALDKGERQAIALAELLQADFLLSDDYKALATARHRGIPVLTTLLILDAAADRGWITFPDAFQHLRETNFRIDRFSSEQLLHKHTKH